MIEPLTPADCDLRGMRFMALDVIRLLDSDLFALTTGDEFKAAVALWCKSWTQVPAASLPDDDRILAHLSAAKNWKRVKEAAMRGWIKCTDGRWYHPVVAEKALDAWDRREDWQEANENRKTRQQRWRERCKTLGEELRSLGITPPRGASLETLEQMLVDAQASTSASTQASTQRDGVDGVEIGKTGTGIGIEIKEEGDTHASPRENPDPIAAATAYGAMAKLLRQSGVDVQPGNPEFRAWVDNGLGQDEAVAGLEAARRSKPAPEPIAWAYLAACLRSNRQKAAAGVPAKGDAQPKKPPTDAWWLSNSGIDRKARELGLYARANEDYPSFKDRIFDEIRKREGRQAA